MYNNYVYIIMYKINNLRIVHARAQIVHMIARAGLKG